MKQIFTLVCLVGCWVGSATQGWGQAANNDATFNIGTGFNGTVRTMVVQSDGRIIVGGDFTSFNGTARNRIARLNADGTLDTGFNPGTGFDFSVLTIALQSNGKIIVGGDFRSFNGTTNIGNIARLNADGSRDTEFLSGTGFSSIVYSVALQSDGKILAAGVFTSYNGIPCNRIVRLNAFGSLDATFDTGTGFPLIVTSITLQADGKIIAGGSFASFNGTARSRIARLNTNGSLDTGFDPGTGFDNQVSALAIQSDGKVIAGGLFTSFNGTARNRIARLNTNGTLDTGFNPGTGFDNTVNTLTLQADGKIFVAGSFTTFNGTARNLITRLNADGSLDTGFSPANFSTSTSVNALALQADGRILVGGSFTSYGTASRNNILRLNGRANSITFGTLPQRVSGEAPFALTATASSGLPVSYTSSNTSVATISGSTVTIVGAGTTTITASQAGNTDFVAATAVNQTLTVVAVTSLADVNNPSAVWVPYPNPASTEVNWAIPNRSGQGYGYAFYNLQGQPLLSGQGVVADELLQWDVSVLPAGVYTLRLQVGSETYHKTVVKQ